MKRITEMTWQEWKEAIRKNDALSRELMDIAMDNAVYWVEEYLHGFPGDYQIGDYGYNFVKIYNDELPAFTNWFNKVQRDFCLFNTDDEKEIEEYIKVANEYYTADFGDNDLAFLNAEEKEEKLKEYVEGIILRRLKTEFNLDDDCLLDFVEEWIDHEIGYNSPEEEEYFLHDDFTIVHHVPRRVVEAHEVKII